MLRARLLQGQTIRHAHAQNVREDVVLRADKPSWPGPQERVQQDGGHHAHRILRPGSLLLKNGINPVEQRERVRRTKERVGKLQKLHDPVCVGRWDVQGSPDKPHSYSLVAGAWKLQMLRPVRRTPYMAASRKQAEHIPFAPAHGAAAEARAHPDHVDFAYPVPIDQSGPGGFEAVHGETAFELVVDDLGPPVARVHIVPFLLSGGAVREVVVDSHASQPMHTSVHLSRNSTVPSSAKDSASSLRSASWTWS